MVSIKKTDIQNMKNLDIEKINLVVGGYNKNKILLQYDNKPMYIKMNTYSPFGISSWKDSNKYSLSVNVEDETQTFLNKLKVKVFTLINSNKGLQKILKMRKFNEDIFNNSFHNIYRESKDEKYKPLMKLGFSNNYDNNDLIDCLVWDKEKKYLGKQFKPTELKNLLGKKTTNTMAVQPFFYSVNKSMGISFKIKHLKLTESQSLVDQIADLCLF